MVSTVVGREPYGVAVLALVVFVPVVVVVAAAAGLAVVAALIVVHPKNHYH